MYILTTLMFLLGCSNAAENSNDVEFEKIGHATKSDLDSTLLFSKVVLFLHDQDVFDIYYKQDTMSFFLETAIEVGNEYVQDIFESETKIKCGRFVYGVDFLRSDTLNVYFDCSSLALLDIICNDWFLFTKENLTERRYYGTKI